MTRIKQLRKLFHCTQEDLSKQLNVSRSTVAMWETSTQKPDYIMLSRISQIFSVPTDYIMCYGVFEDWEMVVKYYDDVVDELKKMIPPDLEMPSFCEDRVLIAWLDQLLYNDYEELSLIRWFAFAVREIHIEPVEDPARAHPTAKVSITFTPEFQAIIDTHVANNPLCDTPKEFPMDELLRLTVDALSGEKPSRKDAPRAKNRIRELRKAHNMTLSQLSAILRVADSTISQYETGKRQPDNDTIQRLSRFFNVSAGYILGVEDKKGAPANNDEDALGDARLYAAFKAAPKETQEAIRLLLKLK